MFATTYAANTNSSFTKQITRGHNPVGDVRFSTVTSEKFSPQSFRRIIENKDMASRRDYLEYTMHVNRDSKKVSEGFLNSPVRNTQPRHHDNDKKEYFDKSGTTVSPFKFRRDLNGSPLQNGVKEVQVKPRLIERSLASSVPYQTLSTGFQRVFAREDDQDQKMRLPVVGYAGHRKGLKAENVFAKNFRDATIGAERNLRERKSLRSNYVLA